MASFYSAANPVKTKRCSWGNVTTAVADESKDNHRWKGDQRRVKRVAVGGECPRHRDGANHSGGGHAVPVHHEGDNNGDCMNKRFGELATHIERTLNFGTGAFGSRTAHDRTAPVPLTKLQR